MTDDAQAGRDAALRAAEDDAGIHRPLASVAPPPDLPRQAGAHRAGQGRQRRTRSFWLEFPVLIAIALTIALLIKSFVVQAFYIPSSSMENTLLVGDKVLVNKLVYDIRPVSRGDIIVFSGAGSWDPAGPPPPRSSNPVGELYDVTLGWLFRSVGGLFGTVPGPTDYIKRVIGIPGDHVVCCTAAGLITVNGVALHEASYVHPGNRPSQYRFSIVVPPGRLWVMGDYRYESYDSRLHLAGYPGAQVSPGGGTIPEDKVVGRAFVIVWPPGRWRVLSVPRTFGQRELGRAAGRSATPGLRLAWPADLPGLAGQGLPVRPEGPCVPLVAALALAVPLTILQRLLRLRLRLPLPGRRRLRRR